jgi:hypothetical protein
MHSREMCLWYKLNSVRETAPHCSPHLWCSCCSCVRPSQAGVRRRLQEQGHVPAVIDAVLQQVTSISEREYLREHGLKATDAKGQHASWTKIGATSQTATHFITVFKTQHGEITAIIKKADAAVSAAVQ